MANELGKKSDTLKERRGGTQYSNDEGRCKEEVQGGGARGRCKEEVQGGGVRRRCEEEV